MLGAAIFRAAVVPQTPVMTTAQPLGADRVKAPRHRTFASFNFSRHGRYLVFDTAYVAVTNTEVKRLKLRV